jgi:hypothetical protein
MALRPASKGLLKATDQHSEPAERDEVEAHQPRNPPPSSVPTEGFSVEVDGKIKSEYPTAEAAAKVGADLKRRFPVLQVTIYDAASKTRTLIEAATTEAAK